MKYLHFELRINPVHHVVHVSEPLQPRYVFLVLHHLRHDRKTGLFRTHLIRTPDGRKLPYLFQMI